MDDVAARWRFSAVRSRPTGVDAPAGGVKTSVQRKREELNRLEVRLQRAPATARGAQQAMERLRPSSCEEAPAAGAAVEKRA